MEQSRTGSPTTPDIAAPDFGTDQPAAFVSWDPSMSVGVAVLDEDHRHLLNLFNGLLQDGLTAKDRDDLSTLLAELRDYTQVHFTREESLMVRGSFPDLETHRAAHRYFVEQVGKLQSEFDRSTTAMLRLDLILLLKEWFVDHIQSVDVQYKPYIPPTVAGG